MFTNIKALIFDLDGTLIDSMGLWRDIDKEYLGKRGIELPDDLQKSLEGMCFNDTAIYFKKRFNLNDDTEAIKAEWNDMCEYKYAHEVPLKEGVFDFLKQAKNLNFKLGIATSNSRNLTTLLLKSKGIYDLFDCIFTGCETVKSKPAPDVYLAVSERLNIPPSQCLVFEDIVRGIEAGKNAGMKVCGVHDINSLKDEEEKKKLSDYYIYTFTELNIQEGI